MSCGSAVAVAQFRPSYRRAAPIQASLAVVGFLACIFAWWETRDVRLLAAGVLLVSVVPLTLIVILPTNKRLLDPALDVSSEEASALLDRWGRLHAIRTIAGLLAFAILLARLAG